MTDQESNLLEIKQLGDLLHGISGGLAIYLHQDASADIGGYLKMCTDYPDDAKTAAISAVTVTADDQELEQWITPIACPGVTQLLKGIYNLHLHAYQPAGTKTLRLYFKVYKRIVAGAETLICTSEDSVLLTGAEALINMHAYSDEVALLSTDRIVMKLYARLAGSGVNPTVTVYVEGTTMSLLQVPVSIIQASTVPASFDNIPPIIFEYGDGFTFSSANRCITVANADTNAWIETTFSCPETRADWEIGVVHGSTVAARTKSGKITAGKYLPGTDGFSITNVFNAANMDLINTNINSTTMYLTSSGVFSAVKGDTIVVLWQADDNSGTGTLFVPGVYLFHS